MGVVTSCNSVVCIFFSDANSSAYKILVERDYLADLVVDGWVILRWILRKRDGSV
jgi:hypothetical protein